MSRRRGEPLTLRAVASRLGVSTATVSNAFNRPSQLSQELREEILFACRQLKYAGPKAEARQRRAKKTNIIAVILSGTTYYGIDEPELRDVLSGLSKVFEHYHYNLLIVPPTQKLFNLSNIESFIEGFIVCGEIPQTMIERIRQHKKTIISVNCFVENSPNISTNNRQSAYQIAKHAMQYKPNDIAIIGIGLSEKLITTNLSKGPVKDSKNDIMIERLEGFIDAASEVGLTISNDNIWSIPKNTYFYAYETAKHIFCQAQKPELVLCMTDLIALGAIGAGKELQFYSPEQFMTTGFSGSYSTDTSLTTVEVPLVNMGKVAAEIFLGLREEKSTVLDAKLRIGRTCP